MAGETRTRTEGTDAPGAETGTGAGTGADPLDGRPEPNYYAVLGVARDASDEEIHRAFRRLAKLWHPDRYTAAPPEMRERAERRMRMLLRARDVLADPVRRHEYDLMRGESHEALGRNARPVEFAYNPPPFFGTGSSSHIARAVGNPNGAGQFAGVLALILALGLVGGTLNGRAGSGAGAFVVLILAMGFFLVAMFCFTNGSQLARAANAWMEADPQPDLGSAAEVSDMRQRARDADADDRDFERLVEEALDTVPEEFQGWLRNVLVEVQHEPTDEMLRQMEVRQGCTLFGLYTGVPLTQQYGRDVPPEIITIFQGSIERYCGDDPDAIRDQVRRTVLHELAHHFGMDHDAMPDWIQ